MIYPSECVSFCLWLCPHLYPQAWLSPSGDKWRSGEIKIWVSELLNLFGRSVNCLVNQSAGLFLTIYRPDTWIIIFASLSLVIRFAFGWSLSHCECVDIWSQTFFDVCWSSFHTCACLIFVNLFKASPSLKNPETWAKKSKVRLYGGWGFPGCPCVLLVCVYAAVCHPRVCESVCFSLWVSMWVCVSCSRQEL